MTCLVVGATGFVGGQAALGLRRSTAPVRALVRGGGAHPKAGPLAAAGIDVVEGDLTDGRSLEAACRGINVVVSTATSMPTGANDGLRRVDREGTLALIDAAERAGVGRFVYVSYSGNITEPSPLALAKRDCEARLRESSMQAVILRPSFFTEVWLSPAVGVDVVNGKARVYGSGAAKVSYISAFDVAAFAVAAAGRDYTTRSATLELGGPEALSQLDAIALFERVRGRDITREFVPIEALEAQARAPDPLAATFGALTLAYAKGDVIDGASDVASRHGVTLRSVARIASAATA